VQVYGGDRRLTVQWDPVPGATGYNVYLAAAAGVGPDSYASLAQGRKEEAEGSPLTVRGLKNEQTFHVVVTAVGEGGEGAPSDPGSAVTFAPIEPPTGLRAKAGDHRVTWTWDPVPGATRYHLYVAEQAGVTPASYDLLPGHLKVNAATRPHTERGLTNDVTYYAVVTAENAGGETGPSAEVRATPVAPLTAPGALTATTYESQVNLAWPAVKGARKYRLYAGPDPGPEAGGKPAPAEVMVDGARSPYHYLGLTTGKRYRFRVTAVRGVEEGPAAVVSAVPALRAFTRLDDRGKPLPDQSLSFEAAAWSCARSNVDGRVWQVESKQIGLHDRRNTYSWYQPATRVGSFGTPDGGNCNGSACDTLAYVQAVNEAQQCGFSDWRLPTRRELEALVDQTPPYPVPTVDTNYFPNAVNSFYWTASPATHPDQAWFVYFGSGYAYYDLKSRPMYVRLVRGPDEPSVATTGQGK
jgi:hypothetical protein